MDQREDSPARMQDEVTLGSTMPPGIAQPGDHPQDVGLQDGAAAEEHTKSLVILDACRRGDIDDLKKLAISKGGFLSDAIRHQACKPCHTILRQ